MPLDASNFVIAEPETKADPVVDLLRRARERISDPKRWCQYQLAVGANHRRVHPANPRAVQWCARGAIFAGHEHERAAADERLREASLALYNTLDVEVVNDNEGYYAVLDVYDHAIALALKAAS